MYVPGLCTYNNRAKTSKVWRLVTPWRSELYWKQHVDVMNVTQKKWRHSASVGDMIGVMRRMLQKNGRRRHERYTTLPTKLCPPYLAGSMVFGCGTDKVQSPELLPLRDCDTKISGGRAGGTINVVVRWAVPPRLWSFRRIRSRPQPRTVAWHRSPFFLMRRPSATGATICAGLSVPPAGPPLVQLLRQRT